MLLKSVDARELILDERELSRRLMGMGRVNYSGDKCYERLISATTCKYAIERLPIVRCGGEIFIGDVRISGDAFARVARGCSSCFIMICTLGIGVDRLIAKEQHLSVSDAFVIDAMADALIEALCDTAERDFAAGLDTAPRFSPGYSDLPLEVGMEIVKLLRADALLGIKFTESALMVPRKSVSAIVCIRD